MAGFKSTFLTVDHIETMTEFISRFEEYERPLALAFQKNFDCLHPKAVIEALKNQGVKNPYLHENTSKHIQRG